MKGAQQSLPGRASLACVTTALTDGERWLVGASSSTLQYVCIEQRSSFNRIHVPITDDSALIKNGKQLARL